MDRPINPPHLSSVSTPTLHPPYNTSTSTPPPTIDPRNNFLHRNHTDGTTRAPLSPSERAEGETWMDFLRRTSASNSTAAPAAAADSRPDHQPLIPRQRPDIHMNSVRDLNEAHNALIAERKRRLTAPDSPERSRRLSGTSAGAASGSQVAGPGASSEAAGRGVPGGSVGMPIDLTETPDRSSRRTSHPRRQSREAGRRESDIVLPPWQPDSEVSKCPVCGNQFGFFYRKHHCRKCGRVVCANCSPHRITIPRQFIVHPPSPTSTGATIVDLTGDDSSPSQSWLGGGEEVRVCNPCVPDPNFSPPPQQHRAAEPSATFQRFPPFAPTLLQGAPAAPLHQHPPRPRHVVFDAYRSTAPPLPDSGAHQLQSNSTRPRPPEPFRDRRHTFQNRTTASDLWPPHVLPGPRRPFPLYNSPHPHHPPRPHHRSASAATPYRSLLDEPEPLPRPPSPPRAPPRRQLREEDECPVCGMELPPKAADGSNVAAEAHIDACIKQHVSGTSVPRDAAHPPPNAGGPTSAENGSEEASASRPRRDMRFKIRKDRATEKDCLREDGEAQECVICFEEFVVGDELGTLPCFCKFHHACIMSWWSTKGPGSCPTHQLRH